MAFAALPNARVTALCDIDERLFPHAVAEVEKLGGNHPMTAIWGRNSLSFISLYRRIRTHKACSFSFVWRERLNVDLLLVASPSAIFTRREQRT